MAVLINKKMLAQLEEGRRIQEGEAIARQAQVEEAVAQSKANDTPPPPLSAILDPTEKLTLNGHAFTVKAMNISRLVRFSKQADPFLNQLIDYFKQGEVLLGSLMSEHGEALLHSIAIAVNEVDEFDHAKPAVADLGFDDFMILAGKVIVVNLDFFRRRLRAVAAMFGAALQHAQAINLAGSTSSTPLRASAGATTQ